jgi:hypothetical protein
VIGLVVIAVVTVCDIVVVLGDALLDRYMPEDHDDAR